MCSFKTDDEQSKSSNNLLFSVLKPMLVLPKLAQGVYYPSPTCKIRTWAIQRRPVLVLVLVGREGARQEMHLSCKLAIRQVDQMRQRSRGRFLVQKEDSARDFSIVDPSTKPGANSTIYHLPDTYRAKKTYFCVIVIIILQSMFGRAIHSISILPMPCRRKSVISIGLFAP